MPVILEDLEVLKNTYVDRLQFMKTCIKCAKNIW